MDQIHATVGDEDTTVIVEDFESSVFTWLPIIADPLDPDTLEHFTGGAYRGNGSAKFTFGQHTDHGVRGLYKAPTRQFLPVVVSERLLAQSGLRLGVPTIIKLAGRQIVVIVMDTVKNFPTMSERTDRFVITDANLLLGHVNVLSSAYSQEPNEVYIRTASDDDEMVKKLARELGEEALHEDLGSGFPAGADERIARHVRRLARPRVLCTRGRGRRRRGGIRQLPHPLRPGASR